MATIDLRTPGVYIEEKNAFPASVVAVETAVPVFIGYTEKAETLNGVNLNYKPKRISSFSEYVENFGEGFNPVFSVTPVPELPPSLQDLTAGELAGASSPSDVLSYQSIKDNKKFSFNIKFKDKTILYMYNAIRLFFLNGGSNCYILSVGTYEGKKEVEIKKEDFNQKNKSVWEVLKSEIEPTIVVIPDVIALGESAYIDFYQQALEHCNDTQTRVSIFDIRQSNFQHFEPADIDRFRNFIGTNALKYGAAYYPWLHTTLYSSNDVDFENIDSYDTLIAAFPDILSSEDDTSDVAKSKISILKSLTDYKAGTTKAEKISIHQRLLDISATYKDLISKILVLMNIMPPSGAMAGVYSLVDSDRGVWKAPANVSLSSVTEPTINISQDEQTNLNVDELTGKSVNIIRPFPGMGTLVWGARTLDGNSQDWRYVNVRRTLIMIEQSLKLATRAYVFEPNTSNTWLLITSMFNNFLHNLWIQGALAGAAPEQAFEVQVGLGTTMTANDILDGIMRISVKLAIVRPSEFIVITFQQQQQQS